MEGATRRDVLRGGIAAAAGAVGLAALVTHRDAKAALTDSTFTVTGIGWHLYNDGLHRGAVPQRGDSTFTYGELSEPAGEFYSTALWPRSPIGDGPASAAVMEMHVFSFADGTLVGMGVSPSISGDGTYAIVGGTGRFEGAQGSYQAVQRHIEFGGDGSAEFTFTLRGLLNEALEGTGAPRL